MGYTIFWNQCRFTEYTYSNVIKLIPKVIDSNTSFWIESWGFVIGISDDECVPIERWPTSTTFAKTNRMPYTKDAMKALILMVEFGAAWDLGHDDTDMTWYMEALEAVHAIHHLASYEMQKEYFTTGRRPLGT